MKRILIAGILAGASISTPTFAATIVYKLAGNFTGTIAGNYAVFDGVFTGVADTAGPWSAWGEPLRELNSLDLVSGGITYNSSRSAYFYGDGGAQNAGFGNVPGGYFIDFVGFGAYNGIANVAQTSVSWTGPVGQAFWTDQGEIFISDATGLTFSATVSGVPEPTAWAMLIGGFAVSGAAIRRRRQKVSIAFA